jgi:hypothetical protein
MGFGSFEIKFRDFYNDWRSIYDDWDGKIKICSTHTYKNVRFEDIPNKVKLYVAKSYGRFQECSCS